MPVCLNMLLPPGRPCLRASLGLSYATALVLAGLALVASALWLHAAGRRWAPGRRRLLAAVPACALNLLLPLLFCPSTDSTTIVIMRRVAGSSAVLRLEVPP